MFTTAAPGLRRLGFRAAGAAKPASPKEIPGRGRPGVQAALAAKGRPAWASGRYRRQARRPQALWAKHQKLGRQPPGPGARGARRSLAALGRPGRASGQPSPPSQNLEPVRQASQQPLTCPKWWAPAAERLALAARKASLCLDIARTMPRIALQHGANSSQRAGSAGVPPNDKWCPVPALAVCLAARHGAFG